MLRVRSAFFFIVLLYSTLTCAQTNLNGIINDYASVTAIDKCANTITVNDAQNFFTGQRVMIMQMKGAAISTSNNATYGDVIDYQSCGNYEINTIENISGSTILFKYAILRSYDVTGIVQLISLNEYTTAAVNGPLRAQPWNGNTGGVILLKADTLILNDSISVSGQGFRGGQFENDIAGQACFNNGVGGATDYFCTTINCGAQKGEGIGGAHVYGRGKNGCGAGGGNDHNTGGGGGGSFGKGGIGGTRTNVSNFNCPGPAAGVGGASNSYSNNKVFLGGGGGAGDSNNNRGTGGGNGGGMVIVIANVLVGNNQFIRANGNNVTAIAGSDGAGGGGGGGAVLLDVNSFSGNLRVTAIGGNGGSLDNDGVISPQAHCMGPGGGGGGGLLWVNGNSILPQITLTDTGGINGHNIFVGNPPVTACPTGTTNGALSGDDGGLLTGLNIPEATTLFIPLTASACCDDTICPGQQVFFQSSASGISPITFEWSNGVNSQNFTEAVSQTTTYLVSVTDALGCVLTRAVNITVNNNPPDIIACCDTAVCSGEDVQLSVAVSSGGGATYSWSSGQTSSSATIPVTFSQTFAVTVTDNQGCEVVKFLNVTVPVVQTNISATPDTAVLAGQPVQLSAAGDSSNTYLWSPVVSLNNPDIQNPVATPLSNSTYCVTVTSPVNCTSADCIDLKIILPDVKVPDAFSPNTDGNNDYFEVFPLRYAQIFLIRIFNRWGEVVFESTTNQPWDGSYKGLPQLQGSYTCVVEYGSAYDIKGRKRMVKDIVLIR